MITLLLTTIYQYNRPSEKMPPRSIARLGVIETLFDHTPVSGYTSIHDVVTYLIVLLSFRRIFIVFIHAFILIRENGLPD